jgi:hypothetical protein
MVDLTQTIKEARQIARANEVRYRAEEREEARQNARVERAVKALMRQTRLLVDPDSDEYAVYRSVAAAILTAADAEE